MSGRRYWLSVLLASSSALAQVDGVVTMAPADQQRAGVGLMQVHVADEAQQQEAYAQVLDAAPLVLLSADIDSRQAGANASAAEAARAERLWRADENLSRRDYEVAQAQAQTDAAQLTASRQRLALEWGPGLSRLTDQSRRQLLRQLGEGRSSLLRLAVPEVWAGKSALSIRLSDGGSLEKLGLAATTDAGLPGRALLLRAATGLQAGATVKVQLQAGALRGARLPPAALLADGKGSFVYVSRDESHFARVPVQVLDDGAAGVMVSGLDDEAHVVVRNAAALRWAATAPAVAEAASAGKRDRDD